VLDIKKLAPSNGTCLLRFPKLRCGSQRLFEPHATIRRASRHLLARAAGSLRTRATIPPACGTSPPRADVPGRDVYYVRGKEDLLALIQERCFTQVLDGARQAVAAAQRPAGPSCMPSCHHHVAFFAQHMAEMKVMSHEASPRAVSAINESTSICSSPFSRKRRRTRARSIAARRLTSCLA